MINELFVILLATLFGDRSPKAFRTLPQEKWQIIAAVPLFIVVMTFEAATAPADILNGLNSVWKPMVRGILMGKNDVWIAASAHTLQALL
jgi:hypothetical protein